MARRFLTRAARRTVGLAAVASAAVSVAGCPHDWGAFESVPTSESAPDGGTSLDAGTTAEGGAAFAMLGENPVLVAADAEGIVLTTAAGSVLACGHAGCTPAITVAAGQKDVRALAIGHGFVAWAARGDNVVRRVPRRAGAGKMVEAHDDDGLVAVGVTASRLYFALDAVGSIVGTPGVRSCVPGESCDAIVYDGFAEGQVTELLLDGADAFWLGAGRVYGCAIAACDADVARRVVLADEPVLPNALAVDGVDVVYASSLEGGAVRVVGRSALAGGGIPRTLAAGLGTVTRLALTSRSVWLTSSVAGTVVRVPRGGGPAAVVASGLRAPTGIAAAAGHVYVTCAGDGRVLRWSED